MRKGDKKGALEARYIILISLAIIGFLAVLWFLLSLGFDQFTESETCRFSVVARATALKTPGIPSETIRELFPLKCATKKICLTSELFGECEQFIGEKNVVRVRLSKNNAAEAARVIMEENANAMYDCWSDMGQLKLDLFGTPGTFGEAKPICRICSRVAFDKEFTESDYFGEVMSKVDLNEYMETQQVFGSELTYLQTFTDSFIRGYSKEFEEEIKEEGKKTTDEVAYIFAQISSEEGWPEAFGKVAIGGFVAAGSVLFTPAGKIILNPVGAIATLGAIGISAGIAGYNAAENQEISAAYCGEFASSEEKRKGCSLVQAVDYNQIGTLNQKCEETEGFS